MNDKNDVFSQRVLNALDVAYAKLAQVEKQKKEAIAILGMACRFPGHVGNCAEFWQLLLDEKETVSEIPTLRWSTKDKPESARFGAFIDDIEQFDARFFGISPREALRLDPQQRLLLELTWHALENAGQGTSALKNSRTGVYIGVTTHDYASLIQQSEGIDQYFASGNTLNALAGRISYCLGLQGPSLAIDSACSSSLVAIHSACQSLRAGECDMALVGASNLMLTQDTHQALAKANMLAHDGRCKTFSAMADGYGRGEGCAVIVLKRLSDAESVNDPILALLKGSAVNQDGASSGFTVPSGSAQQQVIRQALKNADVEAHAVDYLEAHGTGTGLGDPIELGAANAVYGEQRHPNHPLLVGSVKTNIGHLEAAAGMASLIKVVLAMQQGKIPAHLQCQPLSSKIPWSQWSLQVVQQTLAWPGNKPPIAAISSFGASGTNAHLIVQAASIRPQQPEQTVQYRCFTVSAKSKTALTELIQHYRTFITTLTTQDDFNALCYSVNCRRLHFNERYCLVSNSLTDLQKQLASFEGLPSNTSPQCPKIVFLMTGQGAHYFNMGRELYDNEPLFKSVIKQCDDLLAGYFDCSIMDMSEQRLNETRITQVALFCIEYALAKLWQSWGIQPTVVIGHSVGEYAAACLAGVFSLKDALTLISARGQLMQALPTLGKMLAVRTHLQAIEPIISDVSVSIAAYNTNNSLVLSGEAKVMHQLKARFSENNIKSTWLKVSHAFHSPLMQPMLLAFKGIAESITYHAPKITMYANITGEKNTDFSAQYWLHQITQPVQFCKSIEHCYQAYTPLFIEVGPKPVLLGMVGEIIGDSCLCLPSLKAKYNDCQSIYQSLSRLYQLGYHIDWHPCYPGTQRYLPLPNYPWQHRPFWITNKDHESLHNFYQVQWEKALMHSLNADDLLSPKATSAALQPDLSKLKNRADIIKYETLINALESLSFAYVLQALLVFIGPLEIGAKFTLQDLAKQGQVLDRYLRLLQRMVNILIEQDIIKPHRDYFIVSKVIVNAPESQWQQLKQDFPEADIELTLVKRCGEKLVAVLQGACDPLAELLFPEDQAITVANLYQEAILSQAMNTLLQRTVCTALAKFPKNYQINILEIGAGTGGSTRDILAHLPAQQVDYYFTDISPAFLNQAQQKFQNYSFITYQRLDIEQNIAENHFFQNKFDIVIAANVLHATRDIGHALQQINKMLKVGGQLIALENIKPSRFLDIIFGLTEGWWHFEDHDLRDYPLLTTVQWQRCLDEHNFDLVADISLVQQAIIIGQANTPSKVSKNNHLIISDKLELAPVLQAQLISSQHNATCINFSQIEALSPTDYQHIIVLFSDSEDFNTMWTQSLNPCVQLLNVLQSLINNTTEQRLWIVTQQAARLSQSPLWGMRKVIALEHPELMASCLELDLPTLPLQAQALRQEIGTDTKEAQVRLDINQRYIARLQRFLWQNNDQKLHLSGEKTYCVTGGLKGLGWLVSQWLITSGARYLLLLGRSEPSVEVRKKIDNYEKQGVTIVSRPVDVAEPVEMQRVFAKAEQSLPPLGGVIHAAGVLDDGVLLQQTKARFAKVMATKIRGALCLHQYTKDQLLDFFVLFSTTVALFGSAGQANHAGANSFLDALALYRQQRGLCALSINWGPWAKIGAAANLKSVWKGVRFIAPEEGLAALEQLMIQKQSANVGVINIDWAQLPSKMSNTSFFEQCLVSEQKQVIDLEIETKIELQKLSGKKQKQFLSQHIRGQVATVLAIDDPTSINSQHGFFDLGMDSLTSIELRNRLQKSLDCQLAATLAFDYPNVARLTDYLLTFLKLAQSPIEDIEKTEDPQGESSQFDDLSETDLSQLLDDTLTNLGE